MIELKGAGKAFGRKWALRNLSLSVPEGEIFGLVGPNGAGKTTAIKIMTGLLSPTEGNAVICGHDIGAEPLRAKAVSGYVPDRPFFYEKLSGREFLLFVASIYGVKKAAAASKTEDLLASFGLSDSGGELIESYSQGMRQRLLFASALVHDPKVMIIDEPFVGLDPFGVILIKETIKRLSGEGKSVFLATHSLHIAGGLCHRVGLIDRGSLAALKNSEELRELEGGLEGFFLRTAGN